MKLLLDENLPHDLRHYIARHEIFTVAYMNWDGLTNGRLLTAAAAEAGFDGLITLDSGIAYQTNVNTLPISVVVLHAPNNRTLTLLPLVNDLLDALFTLKPRTIVHIGAD
ncbi:MAG TPA: DUF5615 family PIN-like protein [Tepidisphaeraceae bacterium]|jgi:predicted nuclease of predicted toxin-antitoxin system